MFPFKTILCPTDFSDSAQAALGVANECALKFGSEIILLNVHRPIPQMPTPRIDTPDISFDMSAYEARLMEEARANLAQLAWHGQACYVD